MAIPPVILLCLSLLSADPASSLTGAASHGWIADVPPAFAEVVRATIKQPTLQVSTRSMTFPGHVVLYEALLGRPDAVARLWYAEGYTDTKVKLDADGWFSASDRSGSQGRWLYVYRGSTLTVAYGEGVAVLPAGLKVPFRAVVLWRYLDALMADQPIITHSATAYFRLLDTNQHVILRSLRPVAEPIARRKLLEAMLSLSIPVQMAAGRPASFLDWTERAGIKLVGFPNLPQPTRSPAAARGPAGLAPQASSHR